MSRGKGILGWLFLLWGVLAVRAGGPYGCDNGWAIDNSGNPLLTSAVAGKMSQGETGWIRVEMRLIPGHTNWDAAMLGYYDTAVNNARNTGIQVLLLIDGGSWPGGQSDWTANNHENNAATNGDNPYVEGFATNAVVPIVQHFRDRVKFYEVWNEPNAWTSAPSNGVFTGGTFLYPSNYGWMLARSWEAIHKTLGITDVTLFFGGVFGHNIGGGENYSSAGAQYVDDTYGTGTNVTKGGSFAYIKAKYNAFPLDGVGEHLYLTQGGTVSTTTFRQYEDWVRQAYTKYEGTNTTKRTFITEFGWQTPSGGLSQATQDTNLAAAFSTIQATPYVQMAIWFQWQDNPAGGLYYGVLDSSGSNKLAYPDYVRFERFEGMYSNATTNAGIQSYFTGLGQAALGDAFDNGHGAWVYPFLNGYAQDFDGGSHKKLTLMSSTNGTFELNDLHGFWSFYATNNGATNFGYPADNAFAYGGGTRQDFLRGYLTWDSTNQVVWHNGFLVPAPPAGLSAVPTNAQVSLQWNSVSNGASYNVKRALSGVGPFTSLAGVFNATAYADTPVTNGTIYFYVVSASNSYGESVNSGAVSAMPIAPPSFTAQPHSLTVAQGSNALFNASATSAVSPGYQWLFNGTNLSGATTSQLSLTGVQPSNAGNYAVVVSNYGGWVMTSNAVLLVRPILASLPGGVLAWPAGFILQSASNVTGPFMDLSGATSPYTNVTTTWTQQYFRLRD